MTTEKKRPLAGKVAIDTGGGRGLGRAEGLELARAGARVVVNDLGVAVASEERVPRLNSAELIGEVSNVCSFQISRPKSARIRFSM